MNQNIVIPDRPTTTTYLLQEDVLNLADQLGDGATAILVKSIALASGANQIRHNLKRTPRSVHVSPRSNVAWWQPTDPDENFLYINTASALTADLFVWV